MDTGASAEARVKDYGFTQDGDSVVYGVVIENPSSDSEALDISVSTNALDRKGDVIGTDDATVSVVPPGEAFNIGGDISVGRAKVSDLEISVQTDDSGPPEHPLPKVTNVRVEKDSTFGLTIRAQVENTLDQPLSSLTDVFVVVRDSGGDVIGGTYTFPTNDIPPGGRRAVELSFWGVNGLRGADSADVSVDNEIAP
ncbi:MAG: hypothetical protein ACJ762_07770 [Solirubrobacteraceae bacterium]